MKLIALSGYATAGKDATFLILEKYLKVHRFAFADYLKIAIRKLSLDYFGVDPLHPSPEQKAMIRDFMVIFGNTARKHNGRTWINQLKNDLTTVLSDEIAVITDLRYIEEADFVQNEMRGDIVNIERIMLDGLPLMPANNQEAKFGPIIKGRAKTNITASNLNELEEEIKKEVLPWLIM